MNSDKSYIKYKLIVKNWEKDFLKSNGRIPSKYDIKEARIEVRQAYVQYFHLKSQMIEGMLADIEVETPPSPPISPEQLPSSPLPKIKLPTLFQINQMVSMSSESTKSIDDNIQNPHLDISKLIEEAKAKQKQNKGPMIKLSEKLFKNCSFNMRNPRKPLPQKTNLKTNSKETQPQPSKIPENSEIEKTDCDNYKPQNDISFTSHKKVAIERSQNDSVINLNPLNKTLNSELSLKKFDSNWVKRCISDISNVECENKTISDGNNLGLKNINLDNLDIPDCIEDSESENEGNFTKKFQKVRPAVKKRRIESVMVSEAIVDNKSIMKNEPITNKKSIIANEPIIDNSKNKRKKTLQNTKKAAKNLKKNKFKKEKSKESYESNDITILDDDKVEIPRCIITPIILQNDNIIDSLSEAIELPDRENNLTNSKIKASSKENHLEQKIKDGTLNDNFVRINIEKKTYVRGKKSLNYSKFKKQQWKNKKRALNDYGPEFPEGGVLKCFKCGETGHFSRYCKLNKNVLLPLENTPEEPQHQTLQEVENSLQNKPSALNKTFVFQPIINTENDSSEFSDNFEREALKKNEAVPESFLKLLATGCDTLLTPQIIKPLYTLTSTGETKPVTSDIQEALKLFGHSNFRNGQEHIIMRILSGQSTLVTLSTGSGKSLCYQLPAYLYAKYNKCITLVVSPLVSLMEDQVLNMPEFLNACCLHTNQTVTQREKIMDLIKKGNINILLVSPEAIVSGERSTGFGGLLKQLPPIAFACIDEVHCVSQWSHNFRPSYLMVCRVLKEKLKVNCILGLTATATLSTTKSIMEHIGVTDGTKGLITNLPIPENLTLTISRDHVRDQALLELLSSNRFAECKSIIVYCIRRDECERVAGLIRTHFPSLSEKVNETQSKPNRKRKRFNWLVEAYHAGMSATKRRNVQQAFMNGDLKIIVATVAFGMGINKSDIRGIIHYNMPSSFESYVQEVGRAGRDGLPAQCHVFINKDGNDKNELLRHIHSNSIERHVIRKLLQKVFLPCACNILKEKFTNEMKENKRCPGHEVSFSIDDTIRELDIPSENICTLLCYLELHDNKYVRVLNNSYIMCKILSYGGIDTILEYAKKCPPLAMAIALEKKKGKKIENMATFEFCIIDLAAHMGWSSGIVKYHLKNLEWIKNDDKVKKSLLKVEFHTLGFRIMAPGDLDSSELDAALDSLYERTQLQEKTMLNQLQHIYTTLLNVSYSNIKECSNLTMKDDNIKKSNEIKRDIQEYFTSDHQPTVENNEDDTVPNEHQIISDIRGLITSYKDCTFTGRAIARILQGISSPNFPAIIWGRCRYWRSHIATNFYKLSELAKQQIMIMK